MPSSRGRKPDVRSGSATGGRRSVTPATGLESTAREVPQQRLTTAGSGDHAHTALPAVMVAIMGRLGSCEQKVRGTSPLAGSQLKGPRDHREGPLAPPWSHCGSHGISHRTGRCSALTGPSRSACVSARRRAFRMFLREFAAYPASRLADRPRRRPVTLLPSLPSYVRDRRRHLVPIVSASAVSRLHRQAGGVERLGWVAVGRSRGWSFHRPACSRLLPERVRSERRHRAGTAVRFPCTAA
ncbi:Uncharacterised protein [Actinomadura madurae]|nr:Uncharacterised protein [Actinomadura madurae]